MKAAVSVADRRLLVFILLDPDGFFFLSPKVHFSITTEVIAHLVNTEVRPNA